MLLIKMGMMINMKGTVTAAVAAAVAKEKG